MSAYRIYGYRHPIAIETCNYYWTATFQSIKLQLQHLSWYYKTAILKMKVKILKNPTTGYFQFYFTPRLELGY